MICLDGDDDMRVNPAPDFCAVRHDWSAVRGSQIGNGRPISAVLNSLWEIGVGRRTGKRKAGQASGGDSARRRKRRGDRPDSAPVSYTHLDVYKRQVDI